MTSLMVTGHCEPGDRPDLPPPPPPRVNSWDPPGKVAAQRAGSTTTGTWRALKVALPVLNLPFWGARPFPGLRQGSLVPPRRPPPRLQLVGPRQLPIILILEDAG